MSAPVVQKRILIVAGDSDGNLGDRAILQATCQELRAVEPDLCISAVAGESAAAVANIERVPRGVRGFVRLISAAIRADVVLCGGGGLFQDDDSLIKMPYWAARVMLMRLCCRHIVGYSLGVGPLTTSSSRLAARLTFSCMRHISVRDPIARRTAQSLTSKPVCVTPDPASVLLPVTADEAKAWLKEQGVTFNGRPLIGMAVRRWFPPKPRLIPNKIASRFRLSRAHQDQQSAVMCSLLANVLDQLVEDKSADILFMPSYNVTHEGDDRLCREIQNRMTASPGKILYLNDARLYMGVCSQLSGMISGRLHPALLAMAVGTPVTGLAYNPKFWGAFSMRGNDHQAIDIQDFVTKELTDELLRLVSDSLNHRSAPVECTEKMRGSIRDFNRRILNLE